MICIMDESLDKLGQDDQSDQTGLSSNDTDSRSSQSDVNTTLDDELTQSSKGQPNKVGPRIFSVAQALSMVRKRREDEEKAAREREQAVEEERKGKAREKRRRRRKNQRERKAQLKAQLSNEEMTNPSVDQTSTTTGHHDGDGQQSDDNTIKSSKRSLVESSDVNDDEDEKNAQMRLPVKKRLKLCEKFHENENETDNHLNGTVDTSTLEDKSNSDKKSSAMRSLIPRALLLKMKRKD